MSDQTPTPLRTGTAAEALRAEVIAAADRRFRKHGYKSVTMDDIARELGRSKKTLYQVVSNKQELIDLVIDEDIQCDDSAVRQAREVSVDAIDEMLSIARHFAEQLRSLSPAALYDLQKYYRTTWERVDRHHNEGMIETVRANLRRGQAEGLYRTSIDRELIAHLFVKGPEAFIHEQRYRVVDNDWGRVLDEFMCYHINGVATDRGRELLSTHLQRSNPSL